MPAQISKVILIIDDDPDIREVAQASLELIGGHRTHIAANGTAGLTVAATNHPDAILLDIMMPGLDGPATLKSLQADPETRDIDVILLTAKLQPAARAHFATIGVRGIIPKPFNPITLADEIAAMLLW